MKVFFACLLLLITTTVALPVLGKEKCKIFYCIVAPCQFQTCSAYPEATCKNDYCNGCNAIFSVGEKQVDCNVKSGNLEEIEK